MDNSFQHIRDILTQKQIWYKYEKDRKEERCRQEKSKESSKETTEQKKQKKP
jgi:hypothetical protein